MTSSNHDITKLRNDLLQGQIPSGSILERVIGDLNPSELQKLREQAANGLLGLELEKLAMSHRLESSSVDIDGFIQKVKELERSLGQYSRYNAKGEFETASGRTTIEVKKGCYIATAVYGSETHPNVLLLKKFRDEFLMKRNWGRIFCRTY